MRTRTKIICTMGPATTNYETILEMIDTGMNVARINMSHGDHEVHGETIAKLKKARKERDIPLAIMLDTKGPEIRVGEIKGDGLVLREGDKVKIGKGGEFTITPPNILDEVEVGANVLFDDGYISSEVVKTGKGTFTVKILNAGMIRSQKGINIPHADLNLPAVTEKDIADLEFGIKQDVDIVAASFIRSAEHIEEIKALLKKNGGEDILVIAKIECALGIKNFDAILAAADGIMVARGDMGVELPVTQVPKYQKEMIRKSYQAFKPVVTATQMLESMIHSPRPTRAEVSDVANAIYDSTSAVMLSGETAVGSYPVETLKLMKDTIIEAEKDFNFTDFFYRDISRQTFHDVSSSVSVASVKTAYAACAKALVALTTRGFTARSMSRFRPKMPILAITPDEKAYHQLAFIWGVMPILAKVADVNEGMKVAADYAMKEKIAEKGDHLVITSGTPFGVSGSTNTMIVHPIV